MLFDLTSGADPVQLLAGPHGKSNPAVSPDRRWLAYVSNQSGRQEVYVRPFPNVADGRAQVSINGGSQPRWARDGGELYYLDPNSVVVATEFETEPTFHVTSQETLFTIQGTNLYDVASDGRFLVFESADAAGSAGEVIVVENFFEVLKRVGGE
jgi:serine/threonine-protein kinase